MTHLATATPDDVLKSVGQSLDAQVNVNHLILILVGLIGLLVLVSLFTRQAKAAPGKPRALNSPSRLMRQIARGVGLKRHEMRQLKQLAEQENLDNPLVLLLCPSLLQAAMKKRRASVKR